MTEGHAVAVYILGVLTLPALILLGLSGGKAVRWLCSPRRNRIIAWRTWRIGRLERRARMLRRQWNAAPDRPREQSND